MYKAIHSNIVWNSKKLEISQSPLIGECINLWFMYLMQMNES